MCRQRRMVRGLTRNRCATSAAVYRDGVSVGADMTASTDRVVVCTLPGDRIQPARKSARS